MADFREAATRSPDSAEALEGWGRALSRTLDFEAAETKFAAAIALDADLADGELHTRSAVTLVRLGRFEDAQPSFRRARAALIEPYQSSTVSTSAASRR